MVDSRRSARSGSLSSGNSSSESEGDGKAGRIRSAIVQVKRQLPTYTHKTRTYASRAFTSPRCHRVLKSLPRPPALQTGRGRGEGGESKATALKPLTQGQRRLLHPVPPVAGLPLSLQTITNGGREGGGGGRLLNPRPLDPGERRGGETGTDEKRRRGRRSRR